LLAYQKVRIPERRSVMKRLVMLRDGGLKISRLSRPLLGLLVAAMFGISATLGIFAATPASAYGQDTWQIGISGTGVNPGTGFGFGFWGWCAFGGGVTSGTDGDCELSQYLHVSAGSGFTCEESVDITSWSASTGTFVVTGTVTVNPTSLTGPCLALFPGAASVTDLDSGVPAAAGHYNLGGIGGLRGEFQIQVVQIP
jgi:hypothetical protein